MIQAAALGFLPILIALAAMLLPSLRTIRILAAPAGLAQIAISAAIAIPALTGASRPTFFGWYQIDGIAGWMILLHSIVYAAAMASAAHLGERPADLHLTERSLRALFALCSLFIIAANVVVSSVDVGGLWVAMEATTLITAPLIMLQGTKRSVEAAWKYVILCGVGIAFALLASMVLLAASRTVTGPEQGLNIAWLTRHARELKPSLLSVGFVFFLLGYGTKAGLFPLHNWLPDAHSEAPAPASALLSGALLNCAMVALWRIGGIVEASSLRGLLTTMVAPMGAVTVVAAGIMLMRQQDLKRMWAYSSIENMGLLAVAVGLRAAPIFALHALAHSLAKSSAFLLSGNVLREYGTVALNRLGGILRRSPNLGFGLFAAGLAVMGAPPFASFVSEWLLLVRAADQGLGWIVVALVSGLTLSFVAVTIHVGRVTFGNREVDDQRARRAVVVLPAAVLLLGSAAGFVLVTPPVMEFLARAFASGGPP